MTNPDVSLTGDDTYAAFVFSPNVPGVDQVEVTMTFDEDAHRETDGERSFTMDAHASAEAYARRLAAPSLPWVTPEMLREVAIRLERDADPDADPDDVQDATVDGVRAWWLEFVEAGGDDWDRYGEKFVDMLTLGFRRDVALGNVRPDGSRADVCASCGEPMTSGRRECVVADGEFCQ